MGGMFSSPKSVKPPPVPPPEAIPEADIEAGEEARRRRRKGRSATILTGELVPETQKKTLLG